MDLYHALNRGVDKREILLDSQDYARFVHDLFEFNDTKPAGSTYYSFRQAREYVPDILDLRNPDIIKPRERLVDIHGWCLMKNHYHLLLSERRAGGVTQFLRKLNVGYANYFNERYARSGALFQGRTKKVLVEREVHFLYILHYLHLNPLDYHTDTRSWREGALSNSRKALQYLNAYRWSSYLDYVGEKNFPSILTTSLFSDSLSAYKKDFIAYLKDLGPATMPSQPLE